ncbi:ubiquinone anaerobic biosynthesis accessory factor UbiT [Duganella radicis]|uniref:Ubiquinone biosynthesis accessory factor UbiT n=1 Tax=Duganella radicis TaxID=551988 RepID=A0A6L6PQJ4_9BURK|nr:SCP2 sterol-binding domain-containing protein [Duganella radicis]MTV41293.1 sterol-binding protein [Duganella radicis]
MPAVPVNQNLILPPLLAALGRRLPAYPGSLLCVAALNLVLRPHLPDDVRAGLEGRHLRLRVTDAGVAFDFRWHGQGFEALAPGSSSGQPALELGASARDLLALARRESDPDTLFFSRRLSMEGDTELGLLVKNSLDAIEAPLTELGREALTRLFSALPRRGGAR